MFKVLDWEIVDGWGRKLAAIFAKVEFLSKRDPPARPEIGIAPSRKVTHFTGRPIMLAQTGLDN
jgi:hypothetical protein